MTPRERLSDLLTSYASAMMQQRLYEDDADSDNTRRAGERKHKCRQELEALFDAAVKIEKCPGCFGRGVAGCGLCDGVGYVSKALADSVAKGGEFPRPAAIPTSIEDLERAPDSALQHRPSCFACGRLMQHPGYIVHCADDQSPEVGPRCARLIVSAGEAGYQPWRGGPRLYAVRPERKAE